MSRKRYEVQTRMWGGWENCWTCEDGSPLRFYTRETAQDYLDEHLQDLAEAVACGDMEPHSPDEFRVVECENATVQGAVV